MSSPDDPPLKRALADQGLTAARLKDAARWAEQKGLPQLARLLRAAAASASLRQRRCVRLGKGKLAADPADLPAGLASEARDRSERLAGWSAAAGQEGQATVARALEQMRQVELGLAGLLARQAEADAPQTLAELHLCGICGYVALGPPPGRCPVCGAVSAKFSMVT